MEEKEENYIRRERRYGSFSRSIALPAGVDADEIDAASKDGVLEVTIPLAGRGLTSEEVWAGIGHELRPAERQLLTLVVRHELESARWMRIDSSQRGPLRP